MANVLLNDFKTQWKDIQSSFLDAVSRVGASGYLILGPEVKSFETNLATHWGLPHAMGCANGLDAIEIGLRSLDLKPGQKVLTTPLSAFATTLAILRVGGIPVFVDVDSHGLIDLDLAEKVFKENADIKFFVPVHLYGHSLNLKHLAILKENYSLKIVEDCAQSIGAKSFQKVCGSVGQVAATSFYPTKNLGCYGDGGAMLTTEKDLDEKGRCFRDYGQTEKYLHSEFGLNSRLDELQAAILKSALLPRLPQWTQRRQEIAKTYLQKITNPLIQLPKAPEGTESVWHLFPLIIESRRDDFMAHLKSKGVGCGIHYPILIPEQPLFKKQTQLRFENKSSMNNAQIFTTCEVSLPIHPYLTCEELDQVISACNSWGN